MRESVTPRRGWQGFPWPNSSRVVCRKMWVSVGKTGAHMSILSHLLRHQNPYPIVLVGVLTFLSVPVMFVVVYGFWKKRHMGSE